MNKKRIKWKDIVKEYPKLKKIIEKYPHLKKVDIEVKTNKSGSIYSFTASYKDIRNHWVIENGEIEWRLLFASAIPKSGPLLALGSFYYIKKYQKDKIDSKGDIHFHKFLSGGQKFWAKILGFENDVEKFKEFIKENGDLSLKKGNFTTEYVDASFPFELFEKLIEKEWKK